MILDNANSKKTIEFETVAISPSINPDGGYWLRLKLSQPLADKTVFEEVAESLPIKLSPKTIAYILDATLATTCAGVVSVCALKGLEKKMDMTRVRFTNVRLGVVVTVASVMTVGGTADDILVKSREFDVCGENLFFDAAAGDSAEARWLEDGEMQENRREVKLVADE